MSTHDLPDDPEAAVRLALCKHALEHRGSGGPERVRGARAALAVLCQTYWYPLYAYVRRRQRGPDDAQDLTQEFLAQLLEKDYLQDADSRRGKFRLFFSSPRSGCQASWPRNIRDPPHRSGRPSTAFLSLEFEHGEHRYRQRARGPDDAGNALRAALALTLLEQAARPRVAPGVHRIR